MKERIMTPSMLIISETNEKGRIVFANEDFVTMSGYTYDELMGQPHNVLRNPIMPKAAFADMWKTIKNNGIWNGFVCNRCKNGDYYWVYATVSPIEAADGSRHYISIRRKPTDGEVRYYSDLYKTMREAE